MEKSCVLIVEPVRENYLVLQSLLNNTGYKPENIKHCAVLRDAEVLTDTEPHIILSGILLPDAEAGDIVHRLHIKYPGVPIVFIVAPEEEPQALHAIIQGAQDYVLNEHLTVAELRKAIQCAHLRTKVVNDYKRLFDESPGAMYIYDSDTFCFLAVNNAALKQYGYTRDEFLSMKATEIRPEEELARYFEIQKNLSADTLYFDIGKIIHRDKNGRVFYVHVYSHYTIFEGHGARVVMAVDIDTRVKTEELNNQLHDTIRKQNAQMETILSGITEAVWSCRADDLRITYINKASEQIFGYKPHELVGRSRTLLNSIHPEDKPVVDKKIAKLTQKGAATMQFRLYSKTGELKHIMNELVLHKNDNGDDVITGISIDVTESYNNQQRIEKQLEQLREIANIQSHAIRGPVATILGLAQLLEPDKIDSANADIVHKMLTATTKLDNAIKDITDRANMFE